jgi:hypothetical protein
MLSRIDFCFLFLIKNHCRLETFIGPQTGANKKTAGALQIFQSNELFFSVRIAEIWQPNGIKPTLKTFRSMDVWYAFADCLPPRKLPSSFSAHVRKPVEKLVFR